MKIKKSTSSNSDEFINPDEINKIEKKNTAPLIGEVSKEQIEEWKKKFGKVFFINVGGHVCYVKKPTRQILGYAGSVSMVNKVMNALKYNETILLNCWLGGSDEIKQRDDLVLGAGAHMMELVEIADSELGEL